MDVIGIYLSRKKRYLSGVPDKQLAERQWQLLNISFELDSVSMVVPRNEDLNPHARLSHVLAEMSLRPGGIGYFQAKYPLDKATTAMLAPSETVKYKAQKIHRCLKENCDNKLFRFGSYQFMHELHQDGGIFFQSASNYKHSDNLSVKDDELQLQFIHYLSEKEQAEISGAKCFKYTVSSPDFLTLCFTDAINYRMIADWNAEAVVIIHEPDEFYNRLRVCTKQFQSNHTLLKRGSVRYIDPYFDGKTLIESEHLPFCKDYKFQYQQEYRFVICNEKQFSEQERKIYIGSLTDIATLVDLR